MRSDSLGGFSKNYLEHNNDTCRITKVLLALLLCIQIFFTAGCSSNAKVSVENYERTEMQERISTVDGGGEAAAQYRTLTASMTEEERSALNELLDIIIGRTPSKADKKATMTSVFKAVSGIFASSGRAGIEADLKSLVTIARTLDAPVRIIADALLDAKQENKSKFLSQTKKFVEDLSTDQNSVALAESELAGFKSDGVLVASEVWSKLPADSALRTDFLKLLFKFAPSSSVQDLNVLLDRALDPSIQSKIFKGMTPLSATDTNLGVFERIQNSLPAAALDPFIKLTTTYTDTTLSAPVKTALTEAVKKGLVLKESLRPAYLAELNATVQFSDAQVLLNALVDSIDRTTGEGFFALPQFTVRYLKPTAEPACKLKGTSTENVTFSFRWIIGGNPLADWTTPSATTQNSAGSTFVQSTQVLCSVRIFVSGSKVNELNTELVTVRSSAPTFTSGDPPLPETFTSKKGEQFIYNVAARDPVPDLNSFFQLTAQPQHGVVTQTAIGNFEYRPVPAFVGSDNFSFATCNIDNVCSLDKVINLNITDGNQSPRLESMIAPAWNTVAGGLRISRDATLNDVQLVINEDNVVDSTCAVPHVMVLSGDTAKFPQTTANIEVSGVFPYCKLKLSPAAGLAGLGTTTMTLKLDDQVNPPVLSTFSVNVIEKEPQWSTPATPLTFSVNKNSGSHTLQLNAATDPDASLFATPQTLNYVIVSAPAIGTVSSASAVPATGNGTITYTTPMGQPNTQPDQTTDFTYKVCDNASPQNCSPNKTITVNIVNTVPTDITLSTSSMNENNNPNALIGVLTTTDIDGGLHLYTITGGTDQASFNIPVNSNILQLIPSADYETKNSYTVRIGTTDSTGQTYEKDFTVSINNVNEAPTSITLSATTITENNAAYAEVGTLTTTDADGSPHGYSIVGGADQSSFSIVSTNSLRLIPQADYESKSTYTVVIRATDSTGQTFDKSFTISIGNQNETPTGIALSSTSINENNSANALVGNLSTTDPDTDNTFSYSIPAGSSHFTIVGNQLRATNSFNYEAGNSFSFTIRVSDGSNQFDQNFTITINNINEAPTLNTTSAGGTFNEDSSYTITLGQGNDDDTGNTLNYQFVTLPQHGAFGALPAGVTAPASLNGDITYTPQANYVGSDSFSYRVCDNLGLCSVTINSVTLNVQPVNDAPLITANAATSTLIRVSESGPAATITLAAGTDPDDGTLSQKLVTGPTQGTLSGSPTAESVLEYPLSYTPAAGHTGIFQFVYEICDSAAACVTNPTVFIEVLSKDPVFNNSTNDSVRNIAENTGANTATTLNLSGATDPDGTLLGQTISYTVTLETNLGATSNVSTVSATGNGTVDYTPNLNTSGVEILKYKACDNAGNCTPFRYITINIGTPAHPILLTAGDSSVTSALAVTTPFKLGRFVDLSDSLATLEYVFTLQTATSINAPTGTPKSSADADRSVAYTSLGTAGTETFKYKVCRQGTTVCSPEYSVFMKTE